MKHSKLHYSWRDVALRMWAIGLMAFALCLVSPNQSFALTDGWEQCGTCEWTVDDNGDFVVRPVDGGSEGELDDWGNDGPPWVSSASSFVSAHFEGIVHAKNCRMMFSGGRNLLDVDLHGLETSNSHSMNGMFEWCEKLKTIDLSPLDSANVTSMMSMFAQCESLTNLDLTALSTDSLTNMGDMFGNCKSLTTLDLTSFDTSRVTSLWCTFKGCSSLEILDISGLDLSSVTNRVWVVDGCTALKHMDASNVTMYGPPRWSDEEGSIFEGLESLTDLELDGINTSKMTSMRNMFSGCKSLTSIDLSSFDTSRVSNMHSMFGNCTSLESIDLAYLDTSNVTDMQYMFWGCRQLKSLDLSPMDMGKVTTMFGMFVDCESLESLVLSPLDLSSVRVISRLFDGCSSLSSIDLSSFRESPLKEAYSLFAGCASLETIDLSPLDLSESSSIGGMFNGCKSLRDVDLTVVNTSKATSFSSMFAYCTALERITLLASNVASVTSASEMFQNCSTLESFDLSPFADSSLVDLREMFKGCSALKTVDLSPISGHEITSMFGMFDGCTSLQSIDFSGLSSCGDNGYVLRGCTSLESWSIPSTYSFGISFPSIPTPTAENNAWWSQVDQKWCSYYEILNNRKGVADTYTNTETGRPHSGPDFTSGTATLSIGSAIAQGASGDNPAKIDIDVDWDDAWFAADSSTYNHDLGIASSVLASAVYHDDDYSHGTYAKDDLEALGFDMSTYECYYPHSRDDYKGRIDQVGYCFATKWIDGGKTPLVAILVRGTTKNVEWVSNFNIAEHTYPNDLHEGFSRANESLLTALKMYLAKGIGEEVDLSKVVYLVTGHSRGAAVANLLGHSLDEGAVSGSSGASERDRVYVYTFASPNASAEQSSIDAGNWDNIFNIVNPDDLVPKVALAKWGYGRYGVTKVLPSKSNMSPKRWNTYYLNVLQPEFSSLTNNKTLERYPSGAQASDEFADSMFSIAPDIRTYYNGRDIVSKLVPPSHLMQGVGNLLGDGTKTENFDAISTLVTYYPDFAGMLSRTVFKEFPSRYDVITPYVDLLGAFSDAHTSETYIASMMALRSASFDFVESYRGLKVACPVDVRVYDEDGTLVCSIVDNVVDEAVMENGLAASVVGDVKSVDIPYDGQYRVEISATDDGTMDVSYQERTAEGAPVSQVSYADVPLVEGETYRASLSQESDTGAIQDGVSLIADDGVEIDQTRVVTGEEVASINILVGVGEGEGMATGSTVATWGDPVTAVATPVEGSDFLGWYEGGELVSTDASYQFRAEADRSLEARFGSAVTSMADVTMAEVPDQTYTGGAIEPEVSLNNGDTALVKGEDYTLSYVDNVNAGTATVIVTGMGSYEGERTVQFSIAKAAQTVTASDKSVAMGKTVSLGAKASGSGALTYKSSNTAIAKVSATGVVTPVKAGTAKITVTAAETANYKPATKTVTVKVVQGAQTVTASNKTVGVKKSVKLGAKTSGDGKLTYKSSNTKVATVSAKGVVTGKKAGKTKITVTAAKTTNYKAATKTVTVTVKNANTLSAKAKKGTVTASLKTLKSKAVTLASNVTVSKAKGKVSYANASANATAKKFKVDAKTGKVTVPKGTKKGKYQVKVKVIAAGNGSYLSGSKTVAFYIQVK